MKTVYECARCLGHFLYKLEVVKLVTTETVEIAWSPPTYVEKVDFQQWCESCVSAFEEGAA